MPFDLTGALMQHLPSTDHPHSPRVSRALSKLSEAKEARNELLRQIEFNRTQRKEKLASLGRLRLHFPHARADLTETHWKLVWEDYLIDLADYSAGDVMDMCKNWRTSGERFFPTPGQLIGKIIATPACLQMANGSVRIAECALLHALEIENGERDASEFRATQLHLVPKAAIDTSPERLAKLKSEALQKLAERAEDDAQAEFLAT
jgi:hypothetical protein